MRVRPFNTCLVCLCFFIYSSALPQAQEYRNSEYSAGESLSKEPTCDELRAMWRFSKRQSRASEITNEIPTYRDPFAYNFWDGGPTLRSGGRYNKDKTIFYGRPVMMSRIPERDRVRMFEDVTRELPSKLTRERTTPLSRFRYPGFKQSRPPTGGAGSFQHLKEVIRKERARELQEQRLSEEAERKVMKEMEKVRYGRLNQNTLPSQLMDNVLTPKKPISTQKQAMVSFPDILVPASYLEDYAYPQNAQATSRKYKQRIPNSNLVDEEDEEGDERVRNTFSLLYVR